MQRGKFITLEGIDGAGKSSQVATALSYLRETMKVEAVDTREPGGTAIGEKLRALVLEQPMHADTELLLMFAARREHIARIVEPALRRGAWVVSDRFTDASYAYQGGGRGIDAQRIAMLEQWVHADLQPDLTLLFDLAPDAARARLTAGASSATTDRFEAEQVEFFARVRTSYLARARQFPARIRLIDSSQPLGQVEQQVKAALATL
jgi:dTMP kinase